MFVSLSLFSKIVMQVYNPVELLPNFGYFYALIYGMLENVAPRCIFGKANISG